MTPDPAQAQLSERLRAIDKAYNDDCLDELYRVARELAKECVTLRKLCGAMDKRLCYVPGPEYNNILRCGLRAAAEGKEVV